MPLRRGHLYKIHSCTLGAHVYLFSVVVCLGSEGSSQYHTPSGIYQMEGYFLVFYIIECQSNCTGDGIRGCHGKGSLGGIFNYPNAGSYIGYFQIIVSFQKKRCRRIYISGSIARIRIIINTDSSHCFLRAKGRFEYPTRGYFRGLYR